MRAPGEVGKGSRLRAWAIAVLMLGWSAWPGRSATIVWDGSTNTDWGTATNWVGDTGFTDEDDVVFYASGAVNLETVLGTNPAAASTRHVNSLTFNADADLKVKISNTVGLASGQTELLYIGAGGITVASGSAGAHEIAAYYVRLDANQTWTVNSGTTLRVGRVVGGSSKLTLTGGGTLELNNVLDGIPNGTVEAPEGFIIANGTTVKFTGANRLGDAMVANLNPSAILDLNGYSDAIRGLSGTGTIQNINGNIDLRPGVASYGAEQWTFAGTLVPNSGTTSYTTNLVRQLGGFGTAGELGEQVIASSLAVNGLTQVLNGYLTLADAGALPSTSRVNIGDTDRDTFNYTLGMLRLDNTNTNVNDRIKDSAPVFMRSTAQLYVIGNFDEPTTETMGVLTLENDTPVITLQPDEGGATTLAFTSLTRALGTVGVVRGTSLGVAAASNVSQIKFTTTAPTLTHAAGTGDAIGIVPGLLGGNSCSTIDRTFNLVTYDATNGLTPLTTANYTSNTLTAGKNVRLTSTPAAPLAADLAIRALCFDNATNSNITLNLGGHKLNVESSSILNVPTVTTRGATISNGTLVFGNANTGYEAFIYNFSKAATGLTISAAITDNGTNPVSITIGGNPAKESAVVFSGDNTYTGQTSILNGAILDVRQSEVLPDTSPLVVDGLLRLSPGVTETIGTLSGFGQGNIQFGVGSTLVTGSHTTTATQGFYGDLQATDAALVKYGTNTLEFRYTNSLFNGDVRITGGTISLVEAGQSEFVSIASLDLTGGGRIYLNNYRTSSGWNSNDRIANNAIVTLGDSVLRIFGPQAIPAATLGAGNFQLDGSYNADTNELTGPMTFQRYFNIITIAHSGYPTATNDYDTVLNPASISRTNHATALVRGQNLGVPTTATLDTIFRKNDAEAAPTLSAAYSAGSPTMGIVPWMYGANSYNVIGDTSADVAGLVTYDASDVTQNLGGTDVTGDAGFRLLTASEYSTTPVAGQNYKPVLTTGGDAFITTSTAVHGVVLFCTNSGSDVLLQNDGTLLTIAGGAIVSSGNQDNTIASNVGAPIGITFGYNPATGYDGYIFTPSQLDLQVPIIDNGANPVSIVKSGAERLRFQAASTYTGATYINSGQITTAGGTDRLPVTTTVDIGPTGSLQLISGAHQTIAGLTGSGYVENGQVSTTGSESILTVNKTAGTDTYAGVLRNGTSPTGFKALHLIKQGTGTLELTGANTYTAQTQIQAGTLLVNGSHLSPITGSPPPAAPYTVSGAATLGGAGTIQTFNGVTVQDNGILAPGISSDAGTPGTLSINAPLILSNLSQLNYDLHGSLTTPGADINDLITGVTTLRLDGVLNVNALSGFEGATQGMSWRLFNYSGALTNNTLEVSAASQALLTAPLYFGVTAGAGQVNLVVIPEPGMLALLAFGGLACATALRRARRTRAG